MVFAQAQEQEPGGGEVDQVAGLPGTARFEAACEQSGSTVRLTIRSISYSQTLQSSILSLHAGVPYVDTVLDEQWISRLE